MAIINFVANLFVILINYAIVVRNHILAEQTSKTVTVVRYTVPLEVTTTGAKLIPWVVFKGAAESHVVNELAKLGISSIYCERITKLSSGGCIVCRKYCNYFMMTHH